MVNSRASKAAFIVFQNTSQTQQDVTSSTTLVDATGFATSLDANTEYYFKAMLVVSGHTSGDMILKWTIPTGAIMYCLTAHSPTTVSAGIDMETQITVQTTTSRQMLYFEGFIDMGSTLGEVKLQFAQAASNGTATILWQGSHLEIWK